MPVTRLDCAGFMMRLNNWLAAVDRRDHSFLAICVNLLNITVTLPVSVARRSVNVTQPVFDPKFTGMKWIAGTAAQQSPTRPDRAVGPSMVGLNLSALAQAYNSQCCRNGAPTRRQDGAQQQNWRVLPNAVGKLWHKHLNQAIMRLGQVGMGNPLGRELP